MKRYERDKKNSLKGLSSDGIQQGTGSHGAHAALQAWGERLERCLVRPHLKYWAQIPAGRMLRRREGRRKMHECGEREGEGRAQQRTATRQEAQQRGDPPPFSGDK